MNDMTTGAVYVQTNDADRNEVLAFGRNADGSLDSIGSYPTGGRGSGAVHLPSQGSVVLTADGSRLLVANAGSHDISVFAVAPTGSRAGRHDRLGRAGPPEHRGEREPRLRAEHGRARERRRIHDRDGRQAPADRRLEPAAERTRRRSSAGRVQPRRALPRRHRARHELAQRLRGRRGRASQRSAHDRIVGRDAVRVRLLTAGRVGGDRGIRRHGRRGSSVVVRAGS